MKKKCVEAGIKSCSECHNVPPRVNRRGRVLFSHNCSECDLCIKEKKSIGKEGE